MAQGLREFDYQHHAYRDENGDHWDAAVDGKMIRGRVTGFDPTIQPHLAKHGDSLDPQFNADGKSKQLEGSGLSVPDNSHLYMAARLNCSPAPRVTPQRIEDVIYGVKFYHHNLLTICVLDLANGFTVTGESACAAPENYNIVIGEQIAYDMAKQKIWPLEGYLLRQQLYDEARTARYASDGSGDGQRVVGP